jgi:hypothetical protein
VIKRLRFATRRKDVTASDFLAAWSAAVAAAVDTPPGVRPVRIAVCLTLPGLSGPGRRHDGIGIEWFADAGHLQRFTEWVGTPDGQRLVGQADGIAEPDARPVIVAEESIVRGAEWLEQRWHGGGSKLKHMAVAVRASGLTPAEFSRAWRGRAGQIRRPGAAEVTVIPDDARGRAYVQNHPRPRTVGEWAYDAVNEVWFDDLESLRTRIAWFRENLSGQAEADLVRRSWFIAAREEVVMA